MWVAGVLDVLENAGILLELRLKLYSFAPLTALVCRLKWALLAIGFLYISFTIVLWLRAKAAGDDPELRRELEDLGVTRPNEDNGVEELTEGMDSVGAAG